jgi:PAS domain S-box-containing protein
MLEYLKKLLQRQIAEERNEEVARKAAEEAAHEIERQREQLHVTLASIGDAVVVTDSRGNITFLNPVATSLTGWCLEEAAGKPLQQIFRIINEETRREVENPVDRVLRERRVIALANHTSLLSRDGREIPVEDSAAPIHTRNGEVGGVVLVFRDVTASRRAMEDSKRLAAIVESSDDAIIGQDLQGRILSWNRGAQRLYGYTAEEIVGKPLSLLVPADHPDELPGIMERIRRGEYIDHFETVRVHKDGTRLDMSLTISPIRNAEGKVIGASKIARDITARKEEDRRKNEFLALLAHELRNPLAPLRNGLRVIQLAEGDPQAVEHARTMMERQLQHLVRLVDDLLDVSRISRGKLQLRKERVRLKDVVQNALEVCEPMVQEHGRELTVSLPQDLVYVDVDKTRLVQAICNLLSNAVKYSERGGHIWLTAERQGAEALVRVKDNGIGIPPHMLPQVFDLFMQVDRSLEKAQGGLGVGLTIVKRLIEMHGGSVEAHSEGYGKGSEFVIRLPVVLSQAPEAAPASNQHLHPIARRRILVADDNLDSAASLALVLQLMGHEVRTVHDGLDAADAAETFHPHVVLLDIGMPKLNGYDACRRIRRLPEGKDIVIVALTGWGQEDDKRRSQEAGFTYHLVKPIEPAALETLLATLPETSPAYAGGSLVASEPPA